MELSRDGRSTNSLTQESVDYFGTSEHFSSRKKKEESFILDPSAYMCRRALGRDWFFISGNDVITLLNFRVIYMRIATGSRGDVFVVRTSKPVENLGKNGLF